MTRPSQAADPAGDACPAGDAAIIWLSRDEPEQFAALFRLRAPEIRRYVTRRLGADAAEDVVAEARHLRRLPVRAGQLRGHRQTAH